MGTKFEGVDILDFLGQVVELHLQDRRDQFGQADKAINLRLAVSTFLT